MSAKPITRKEFNNLSRQVRDALKLASTHDPDLVKQIKALSKIIAAQFDRIVVMERQLERLGAPQYRRVA